ncbi:MAG: ABC transporter permease subunit [Candidatus Omnitrophica bacterium]|nr:ABC transporter permease subunit [Candidatus Omnitrophota bacterium]
MRRYILKRLILMVPMLIGISFILFVVMHLAPGDPASIKYGLNPEVSESARANFSRLYDLDKPVLVQYFLWMKRFLSLDFGRSFIDGRSVMDKILAALPATLLLQACSIFLIFSLAIPIGVISAVKRGSVFDNVSTVVVFIGYAVPTFWLALLLILFFGFKLQWFPISGMNPWYTSYLGGMERVKDLIWHLVLPVVTTAFGGLAALSRYSRSSMIEALGEKYILTARAKGLTERGVVMHALRNALMPIVTIMGLTLPALISGSFIFETIFAWPGMGRLGYQAIMNYDYPVVMGVAVIATILTLLGIFLSDVMYALVDPRVRIEKT